MPTWRDRARWGSVLLVVLALPGLGASPEPAGARVESAPVATPAVEWPTTEFKVVHRAPPQYINAPNAEQLEQWLAEVLGEAVSDRDRALGDLIERYLRDAAWELKEANLLAPALTTFRDVSDGLRLKYVVYIGSFGEEAWIQDETFAYASEDLGLLAINRDKLKAPTDGKESPVIYRRAAHELFHAIQFTYRRQFASLPDNSLADLKWTTILEGMAEGAATHLTVRAFRGYLDRERDRRWLGGYAYQEGFLTDEGPAALLSPTDPYNAGSFWFHLAERFGGLSILDQLMRVGLPGPRPTSEQLLEWLDNGLRFFPKERLFSVYPHFITELASYGGRRYKGVSENDWQQWVVGYCDWEEMTVTSSTEVVSVTLDYLKKMGTACARVHWKGLPEDGTLKVEVRHPEKAVVDQIHLGTVSSTYEGKSCWEHVAGNRRTSCELERLTAPEQSPEGWWGKTWRLPDAGYGSDGSALFVLTNNAFEPWKTQAARDVKVVFSFARTPDHTGQKRAPAQGLHLKIGAPTTPGKGGAVPALAPPKLGQPAAAPGPKASPGETGAPDAERPSYWQYRTYGINPDPPVQETLGQNLLPITPIVIPKGTGPRAIDGPRYIVTPHPGKPLPLGYTGPLHGFVLYEEPPDPERPGSLGGAVIGKIGSPMCPDADKRPIGQVLVNTTDLLKVRVQTDLCTIKLGARALTVVERLDVTVVLPFGWRYQEPAPKAEITPGVDYYVLRYFARVEGRLEGDWPFGNPKPDITPGTAGGPTDGAATGGSATGAPLSAPCDCSCAGYQKVQDLSKRRGDPKAEAEMKALMPCLKPCIMQWTGCRR